MKSSYTVILAIIILICVSFQPYQYMNNNLYIERYINTSFPVLTGDINNGKLYLSNRTLRIGVDLNRGCGVFHLAKLTDLNFNYINHFDVGRMLQQSYYGDKDGSKWADKNWVWNPVQAGSWTDKPSETLSLSLTKTGIQTKVNPRNWGGEELLKDVLMESQINMYDDYVHIKFSMTYTGKVKHKDAKHQELPAVFIDRSLPYLNWYKGNKPWTNQPLQRKKPKILSNTGGEHHNDFSEGWAAFEHPTDKRAVGVYSPVSTMMTCYLVGDSDSNVRNEHCSYFAPLITKTIVSGETYTYNVYVTLGTVEEIRNKFKSIYTANKKR